MSKEIDAQIQTTNGFVKVDQADCTIITIEEKTPRILLDVEQCRHNQKIKLLASDDAEILLTLTRGKFSNGGNEFSLFRIQGAAAFAYVAPNDLVPEPLLGVE